jgi:hypothetical protein
MRRGDWKIILFIFALGLSFVALMTVRDDHVFHTGGQTLPGLGESPGLGVSRGLTQREFK